MAKTSDIPFPGSFHDFFKPGALRVAQDPGGPSLTHQEFADDADINSLMRRFPNGGFLPPVNQAPVYLDLAGMPQDLQSALNLLKDAESAFMSLSAEIRREFDNDPVSFVEYAMHPDNLDQMREWGLAEPAVIPDAPKEPVAPPSPATPPAPPAAS